MAGLCLLWASEDVIKHLHLNDNALDKQAATAQNAIIAISGGQLDIQEESLYPQLHKFVRNITKNELRSVSFLRHISEWKTLCEDVQERLSPNGKNFIHILTMTKRDEDRIQKLLTCLEDYSFQTQIQQLSNLSMLEKTLPSGSKATETLEMKHKVEHRIR